MDELACLEREAPAAVRPAPKGRVCIEVNGIAGPECRPDASTPFAEQLSPGGTRILSAAAVLERSARPPRFEIEPPELSTRARDGHARALDEPPRAR